VPTNGRLGRPELDPVRVLELVRLLEILHVHADNAAPLAVLIDDLVAHLEPERLRAETTRTALSLGPTWHGAGAPARRSRRCCTRRPPPCCRTSRRRSSPGLPPAATACAYRRRTTPSTRPTAPTRRLGSPARMRQVRPRLRRRTRLCPSPHPAAFSCAADGRFGPHRRQPPRVRRADGREPIAILSVVLGVCVCARCISMCPSVHRDLRCAGPVPVGHGGAAHAVRCRK
jgi:hypothetical protein